MQEPEQQIKALAEFARLAERPVLCFAWYQTAMIEPDEFRRWRIVASVVYRCELWQACGLPRVPGMLRVLYVARIQKRAAYRQWLKLKHQISADFIAGRSQIRPPWGR